MSLDPTSPTAELIRFQTALAGRYSIERELGRGGMGIVFLAREVALDRLVALKLLPPALAARAGVKERFLREARTAARLSHPNIVQIYSVDEVDDFVFFAMAYVDGGTLGERIRERGPLSNSEAVRLLREVAWALGHAHLQGVIHRDVKPDNILLDQESGRAMVTDFGIALAGADTEGEVATQVVGTAEFISPEQARGAPVDARSDLYSLACVGFYALSGTVPFTADSASAVLVKHVTASPPTVLSAAPHAPPLVASALDRCLRKDPEQRFTRGDALADALGPQQQTGEMAVPLRVFIKQSREWETNLAYCMLALSFALPMLAASTSPDVPFLITAVMVAVVLGLFSFPVLSLARAARRLLKSGFTQADATVAFLKDIDRKEEEYRFEVGERVTFLDRAYRALKLGGFALSPVFLGVGLFSGAEPASWYLASLLSFDAGILGTIFKELRARSRGDVMGERFLRLWKSRLGRKLFQLGGLGLERVAPALSPGIHRPTEVVIGLEADRLFEALPKDVKRTLEGLPATVQALEKDAQALRKQVSEMDAILAEIGDDDPSRPSSAERARVRADVEVTRSAVQDRLRKAVAALETIRLGLLYMQAGSGGVESLTMELKSAREISDEMENLLAGHREVERILRERRETGVFRLVGEGARGDAVTQR